jgi:HSP20 family protein
MVLFHDPFETLLNLQRTLDTFRDSGWLESGLSASGPFPPLNVFRKGEDIVVLLEVPGIDPKELHVEIKERTLRIAGTKKVAYHEKVSLHRRERTEGRFDRTVSLPVAIDAEQVKAECRDGILALYLPRSARDKPRTIAIN